MLPIAILAGGYATRLGRLSVNLPKCLVEIDGKPFVDWQLDLLIKNGYTDFIFCVSHKAELIQRHLKDGSDRGIQIKYSLDGQVQLGTGGAIQKALPLLGDEFAVIYGDSYLPIDYAQVEEKFRTTSSTALMTVYKNHNKYDTSNVEFKDNYVLKYAKGIKDSKMKYIDYGLTYFHSKAFARLGEEASFDLSEKYHDLSVTGNLSGFEVFERFYEIGSVNGIAEFSERLRRE